MAQRAISDDYLTVPQAAATLGMTGGRVRQLLLAGEINGEKLSDGSNAPWFISRREVQRYSRIPHTTGRPRSAG